MAAPKPKGRTPLKVEERCGAYYCALLGHLLYRPARYVPGEKGRADFERYVRRVSPDADVIYVTPNASLSGGFAAKGNSDE